MSENSVIKHNQAAIAHLCCTCYRCKQQLLLDGTSRMIIDRVSVAATHRSFCLLLELIQPHCWNPSLRAVNKQLLNWIESMSLAYIYINNVIIHDFDDKFVSLADASAPISSFWCIWSEGLIFYFGDQWRAVSTKLAMTSLVWKLISPAYPTSLSQFLSPMPAKVEIIAGSPSNIVRVTNREAHQCWVIHIVFGVEFKMEKLNHKFTS